MSQTITPAPVRKTVTVGVSREKAFRVFTEGFDRWWPRTHKIGKTEMVRAILEPRAGGRWYEVGEDGAECEWGDVLAWEPPSRVLLAWRLNAEWGYDPDLQTEVEVTFTALSEHETEVRLEHRHLERMGPAGAKAREMVDSPGGWGRLLEIFKSVAEA